MTKTQNTIKKIFDTGVRHSLVEYVEAINYIDELIDSVIDGIDNDKEFLQILEDKSGMLYSRYYDMLHYLESKKTDIDDSVMFKIAKNTNVDFVSVRFVDLFLYMININESGILGV